MYTISDKLGNESALVAVYGSLRQRDLDGDGSINNPLHNSCVMREDEGGSIFKGIFKSEEIFEMHSLGGFPGLRPNGNNSVVFEVYEVQNKKTAIGLDRLEGYYEQAPEEGFYDRILIDTPYGKAWTYIINDYEDGVPGEVESGDWKEFITSVSSW